MVASLSLKDFGTPPFVRPMQEAIDRHAQQRRTLTPDALEERAQDLLEERFGAGPPAQTAFARGSLGVLAEHTHYSKGFAVLLPLPQGTAVAVRPASHPRAVFSSDPRTWNLGEEEGGSPAWVRLVDEIVQAAGQPLEVAVTSTILAACFDTYLAALGIAVKKATALLVAGGSDPEPIDAAALQPLLARCASIPFSPAYPLASIHASPPALTLVDTATCEALPIEGTPAEPSATEAAASDVLGWGLVSIETPPRTLRFYHRRREQAAAALARLRTRGFPELEAFRDLDHRDLARALAALPETLRPIARHLVTENRRVPRLVGALQRQDGQLLGALLLMSHASLQGDWKGTSTSLDLAVQTAERLSMEGIYGARMTGRGGCMLMVGRPLAVADALEQVATTVQEQTGRPPIRMLL